MTEQPYRPPPLFSVLTTRDGMPCTRCGKAGNGEYILFDVYHAILCLSCVNECEQWIRRRTCYVALQCTKLALKNCEHVIQSANQVATVITDNLAAERECYVEIDAWIKAGK